MRRSTAHLAFGVISLCCVAMAGYDALQLKNAGDVARAVANPQTQSVDAPEVRLARAMALSKAQAYADAQRLYDALIQDENSGRVANDALFNLGNMNVRQATGEDSAGAVRSLPLLEQAKQHYRQLLRTSPDDWDARYNLERALWLAPEAAQGADEPDVKEQHDVKLRGAQAEDLP